MRLISQNGAMDIPYESVSIYADMGSIYAKSRVENNSVRIGLYSSQNKALKVMKIIQETYMNEFHQLYFQLPYEAEVK